MRQRASLDVVANGDAGGDDNAGHFTVLAHADDAELDTEASRRAPEDSRSTSSTSSPAPPDNEESDFFLNANDSQSSLGVPNIQDMQVADDECIPPVNRLPNEILIAIFSKLSTLSDVLHVMLTCKRWSRNAVDILWHRPSCTSWEKHNLICRTLSVENPYFHYRDFVKRLNLASLHESVNDGSVVPLAACNRVERLTLTNCKNLTDSGLIPLITNNTHLLALDISNDDQITEASIYAIAEQCKRLQGLNVTGCGKISNESLINLAKSCRYLKRLKLNDCSQIQDEAVSAFASHCPNILEIDLHQCRLIGNEPVTALLENSQALRELRLAHCELIDDSAFLSLSDKTYEHLRILDLTSCVRLTDRAVEKIIDIAPRLRNLVLAKCRNLTDAAVYSISRLGKNLHFLHLGHCSNITDDAVKRLVTLCNRIRYIDLGCCTHLTDESVTRLATLPKLKRIGLVKCANITDRSVVALAKANQRSRLRKDQLGKEIPGEYYSNHHSSLERVHLSYCLNLTLKGIIQLLNCCPRLTHLSLTGVPAFLREDLEQFSRDAPQEFTVNQRSVFCVFSGQGVASLRRHLNNEQRNFADLRITDSIHPDAIGNAPPVLNPQVAQNGDINLDDTEADLVDDDDGLEDATEMVIDAPNAAVNNAPVGVIPVPPPIPGIMPRAVLDPTLNAWMNFSNFLPSQALQQQQLQVQDAPLAIVPPPPPLHHPAHLQDDDLAGTGSSASQEAAETSPITAIHVPAQNTSLNGTVENDQPRDAGPSGATGSSNS
ncbi:SCF E3 ubiquitin ligase complex F-box protein grrA [Podospora fimiseda]|uniref:SCF E3 ubiquitin ligase complex F-box protein grrA n=1 Tax=Podospora fimiseda TaxID=252190 RepID=A0AAN7BFP8_9PEZI|nr:SCF E3 ubiquitin ligase complex F-box protein grrA [Podospora fimiseda]